MATKSQPAAHPPLDPSQVLIHLGVLGITDVKVKKDGAYQAWTEWAFTKGQVTVRIEEHEHYSRHEVWSRSPSVATGKRSIAIKAEGEWRSNRKFHCSKNGWGYAAIAETMKFLFENAVAKKTALAGFEGLRAAVAAAGFKVGSVTLDRDGGGSAATLRFRNLNTEQVLALLKAAKDAGVATY
jgi:hypothetical protein